MPVRRIAKIGDRGTALPARLRYSRTPNVLAPAGDDATAAVWECVWSPNVAVYLASLDIPRMLLKAGVRSGQRDKHISGFVARSREEVETMLPVLLAGFPRQRGYIQFARQLRRNLHRALQGAEAGPVAISLLGRGEGAVGFLHQDQLYEGNKNPDALPISGRSPRRMLVTLPTSPDVRGTILDATAGGLSRIGDGNLYGDPDDAALAKHLVEMKPGQFGVWNMQGPHTAHTHSEPRVKISCPHRLSLLAARMKMRQKFLHTSRTAPTPSAPRLTVVISLL